MDKFKTVNIVAGVIIEKDGKFLLVQEKKKKVRGKWNLPAGRVEVGSTIEKTAIKEAQEETGFKVKLNEKVGVFHESLNNAVKHIFSAEITGGKLIAPKSSEFPEDELLGVNWFSLPETKKMAKNNKLRGRWILEAINLKITG